MPLVATPEYLLQLRPDVSVDDHVEAGVDQAVQVGEDDQGVCQARILCYHPHHEDNSVGPPADKESCIN